MSKSTGKKKRTLHEVCSVRETMVHKNKQKKMSLHMRRLPASSLSFLVILEDKKKKIYESYCKNIYI